MKIHKLSLDKKTLALLSREERTFYIIAGHLFNEINFLVGLLSWFSNFHHSIGVQRTASGCQATCLAKILAGKLNEAWEILSVSYFSSKLGKNLDEILEDETKIALSNLKRYFGNSACIIRNVRNIFAFHYYRDLKKIEEVYQLADDSEQWDVFLHETRGNTLYYLSEMIIGRSMMNSVDPNMQEAFKKIIAEVYEVSAWFLDFIDGCMGMIAIHRFGNLPLEEITIDNTPRLEEVRIPFFVDLPPRVPYE